MLKKRQVRAFQIQDGIQGEVSLVERAFDLRPDAFAEAIAHFSTLLAIPMVTLIEKDGPPAFLQLTQLFATAPFLRSPRGRFRLLLTRSVV